mmetsp:Transcript_3179/g.9696  ORF Transcript_3179/g.9696 Transcript_3179/m.9696 type:complete len:366 (-) Transcript_3179:211-1308(-)
MFRRCKKEQASVPVRPARVRRRHEGRRHRGPGGHSRDDDPSQDRRLGGGRRLVEPAERDSRHVPLAETVEKTRPEGIGPAASRGRFQDGRRAGGGRAEELRRVAQAQSREKRRHGQGRAPGPADDGPLRRASADHREPLGRALGQRLALGQRRARRDEGLVPGAPVPRAPGRRDARLHVRQRQGAPEELPVAPVVRALPQSRQGHEGRALAGQGHLHPARRGHVRRDHGGGAHRAVVVPPAAGRLDRADAHGGRGQVFRRARRGLRPAGGRPRRPRGAGAQRRRGGVRGAGGRRGVQAEDGTAREIPRAEAAGGETGRVGRRAPREEEAPGGARSRGAPREARPGAAGAPGRAARQARGREARGD